METTKSVFLTTQELIIIETRHAFISKGALTMSDKTTPSGKRSKQPINKNHSYPPDYTGDNPRSMGPDKAADDAHNRPSDRDRSNLR
jgi:hypothetical protein